MLDECECCCKKASVSGCFNCKIYKIKSAITQLQESIDNKIYINPLIFINKDYEFIKQHINFKGIQYRITNTLPDDVVSCIINKDTLDFRRFYEDKYEI